MKRLSIGEIAVLCGGKYTGTRPERLCGEIVTDSRKLSEDCVFFALKGERFDGHDYAVKALENGAAAFTQGASASITGNMLTTSGTTIKEDLAMLNRLGLSN